MRGGMVGVDDVIAMLADQISQSPSCYQVVILPHPNRNHSQTCGLGSSSQLAFSIDRQGNVRTSSGQLLRQKQNLLRPSAPTPGIAHLENFHNYKIYRILTRLTTKN